MSPWKYPPVNTRRYRFGDPLYEYFQPGEKCRGWAPYYEDTTGPQSTLTTDQYLEYTGSYYSPIPLNSGALEGIFAPWAGDGLKPGEPSYNGSGHNACGVWMTYYFFPEPPEEGTALRFDFQYGRSLSININVEVFFGTEMGGWVFQQCYSDVAVPGYILYPTSGAIDMVGFRLTFQDYGDAGWIFGKIYYEGMPIYGDEPDGGEMF